MGRIDKKVRFEVFKRDKFTCQYCGGKAPDVFLEIDHIVPIILGGKGEMRNLITACQPCNVGKRDSLLKDESFIQKYQEACLKAEKENNILRRAMVEAGRKGGQSKSERKAAAARENGKKPKGKKVQS